MSKNLQEEISHLSELIRKANELINPEDSLAYLTKKDIVDRLYGEKPKCFLKLNPIGQDVQPYLLPLCNRNGIEDPKVINLSLKLVKKLIDDENTKFDSGALQSVLNKLNHRSNVFNKNVPKPASQAARKANVTKMFGRIKSYLDMIKTDGTD
jgi:hypothetical protein